MNQDAMNAESRKVFDTLRSMKAHYPNIRRMRVFGSVARGVATKDSDVDLIVDFYDVPDLFEFSGLQLAFQGRLHRRVDLMTDRSLHPALRDEILKDAQDV